eukprot:gene2454-3031_t
MVLFAMLCRVSDGLMLSESMDMTDPKIEAYRSQARLIFGKLTRVSEKSVTFDTGEYYFASYPKKLAFFFLEELQKEFDTSYGPEIALAKRPYQFVKFESFITKTKKLYKDTKSQNNLTKVSYQLRNVQNIMNKNIQDIVSRGEKLDDISQKAELLLAESAKYEKQTLQLNAQLFIKKYGPILIFTYIGKEFTLRLLISKALGYAIVFGALILKVPQILKIVANKSAESISISSVLLETIGFTISTLVGLILKYPFSTYGESIFILIQNIIVLLLVLKYSGKKTSTILIGSLVYCLCTGTVVKFFGDEKSLLFLQALNIPLFIISKIPQISTIYKAKSVGQLSFFTCILNFGGSLSRVFTCLTELNDPVIVVNYLIGTTLNAIIVAQFLMYWNNKAPARRIVQSKTSKKNQ